VRRQGVRRFWSSSLGPIDIAVSLLRASHEHRTRGRARARTERSKANETERNVRERTETERISDGPRVFAFLRFWAYQVPGIGERESRNRAAVACSGQEKEFAENNEMPAVGGSSVAACVS